MEITSVYLCIFENALDPLNDLKEIKAVIFYKWNCFKLLYNFTPQINMNYRNDQNNQYFREINYYNIR